MSAKSRSGLKKSYQTIWTRDNALSLLRREESNLRDRGVSKLWLFGSVARNEAHQDSDIDLLVKFRAGSTLFDHGFVQAHLEDLFQVNHLDLVTTVHRDFRPSVEKDKILAF